MTSKPPSESREQSADDRGSSRSAIRSAAAVSDPSEILLSIVVPTFNEQESIERTLASLYDSSSIDPAEFEVIVVDESTDETPEVVLSQEYRNLRLMRFDEQLGLAGSVIRGFDSARGDYLGVIDADGQHPPEKLYELFQTARADDRDVVIASRYTEGGGIENWSSFRKLVSIGATTIAKGVLLGQATVSDPMSGFFVVRRELLDDVSLNPVGYKILLDILVRTDADAVDEVGYVFTEREHGESNLDYGEYLNYLEHVGRLLWYRVRR